MSDDTTGESHQSPAGGDRADAGAAESGDGPGPEHAFGTRALGITALVVAVVSLFGPISASGIWDPPELEVIDLARRIGHTLLGGARLAIDGANNVVPTQGELGKGQLPFTSVAVGLRLFGMSEWAGRLPLALWGLLGIGATWLCLARLADRRAASFGAIALATMPLYFLHARTMLGDIVTMSTLALAVAGLALAAFDRGPLDSRAIVHRTAALLLGLGALVLGVLCRGILVGTAVPALAVGLAWSLGLGDGKRSRERFGDAVGALSLAIGVVALGVGVRALGAALDDPGRFSLLLGSAIKKSAAPPSFDVLILQLGHALIPWSAVVPFALGRMFAQPPGSGAAELERQSALRSVLLMSAVLALGVQTWLSTYVGVVPYAAPFACAAMVGLCFSDLERGAPGSRVLAMGVAALAVLLLLDFMNTPEKGLSAYVVSEARFPESFRKTALAVLLAGTSLSMSVFFFAVMERAEPQGRDADYLRWPRELRKLFDGNVFFTLLVVEGALIAGRALLFVSDHLLHVRQLSRIGVGRPVLEWGLWVLPLAIVAVPIVVMVVRDIFRFAFSPGLGLPHLERTRPALAPVARAARRRLPFIGRARVSPGTLAVGAVALFGLVLSLGYYPALAAQVSPKEVFESYRAHARPGDALGMIGRGKSASATYYAGRQVPSFVGAPDAFDWLMGVGRRWLVIRSTDLAQLNSLYRARAKMPRNVPVLDARSSEILLVSNRLEPSERNENPFEGVILDAPPSPAHRLDVDLGGQLQVLGWSVTTSSGALVSSVEPGRRYQFVIYYKVLAPISGAWETFVHIDGYQRRYNADHTTLDGKYPLNLWRTGDYVADSAEFTLEPNFTPGTYNVYFGLFIGSRRLEVKRGRHSDNRIEAGHLDVR